MAFANGGLVVHQAPDTLSCKIPMAMTNAIPRKSSSLLAGVPSITHAGPSNLRYGHDNWLYTMVGYSGFSWHSWWRASSVRPRPGSIQGRRIEARVYTQHQQQLVGLGFSEDGLLFGSTANGCPSVYAPLANRHYESVRGWSSSVLENIAPGYRFYPITETFDK